MYKIFYSVLFSVLFIGVILKNVIIYLFPNLLLTQTVQLPVLLYSVSLYSSNCCILIMKTDDVLSEVRTRFLSVS